MVLHRNFAIVLFMIMASMSSGYIMSSLKHYRYYEAILEVIRFIMCAIGALLLGCS